MSSEAEKGEPPAKKAENGVQIVSSTGTFIKENWSTALKIVELVFIVFCVGLVVDPVNYGNFSQQSRYSIHSVGMIFTAYGGYIIINSVFIIGRMLGERPGWKTSVIFSLVGAVVFVAAAACIISQWSKHMYQIGYKPSKQYMDMFISSGVFAIFTAAIFILDAIFTYREEP